MNKKAVIFATSTLVLSITTSALTSYLMTKNMLSDVNSTVVETTVEEEISQAEVVNEDTGEVTTYVTGGTDTIYTDSGESINVTIANDQYNISDDYLSILAKGFGTDAVITADNLVITGDKPSVTQSRNSINAATFSDIFDIYCQIYGEEFKAEGIKSIWSPAYTYMVEGKMPEGVPETYTVEEYETVDNGGIIWKFYNVNYDSETTQPGVGEQVEVITTHTQFLVAYSNTEDPVEIMCYEENNNVENQYQMILDFLGIE